MNDKTEISDYKLMSASLKSLNSHLSELEDIHNQIKQNVESIPDDWESNSASGTIDGFKEMINQVNNYSSCSNLLAQANSILENYIKVAEEGLNIDFTQNHDIDALSGLLGVPATLVDLDRYIEEANPLLNVKTGFSEIETFDLSNGFKIKYQVYVPEGYRVGGNMYTFLPGQGGLSEPWNKNLMFYNQLKDGSLKIDGIVVFPSLPDAPTSLGVVKNNFFSKYSSFLDNLDEKYHSGKKYLIGYSLGGRYAYEIAPLFDATLLISGFTQESGCLDNIKNSNKPIYLYYGDKDDRWKSIGGVKKSSDYLVNYLGNEQLTVQVAAGAGHLQKDLFPDSITWFMNQLKEL